MTHDPAKYEKYFSEILQEIKTDQKYAAHLSCLLLPCLPLACLCVVLGGGGDMHCPCESKNTYGKIEFYIESTDFNIKQSCEDNCKLILTELGKSGTTFLNDKTKPDLVAKGCRTLGIKAQSFLELGVFEYYSENVSLATPVASYPPIASTDSNLAPSEVIGKKSEIVTSYNPVSAVSG